MTREVFQVQDNVSHPAEPAPEEKLEQLDRILHSRVFQGSGIVMTMLEYLARQSIADPSSQVKEYTVALEVFGRGSEFDPRTNSIVRVQAKRLRAKLHEYYETEGKPDPVLIDLPKGHYKVSFSYIEHRDEIPFFQDTETSLPPADASTEIVSSSPNRKSDAWKVVLIAAVVILTVAVTALTFSYLNLRRQSQQPASLKSEPDYGVVWAPFLQGSSSTLMVLSNPAVYRFLNNSDPEVVSKKSVEITKEQAEMLTEVLKDKLIMRQGRPTKLVLSTANYTGMGEAIGLYHITNLFKSAGKDLTLKQSRTFSAEDLKNHNVILLGSAWVNDWVEKLPVKEDFTYTINASIENKDPLPGEEREYKPRYDERTGEVKEDYALITVKPGVTDERRLMILAGLLSEGTQAAAEYVTRKEYLNALNQRLQQVSGEDGPPKYYQVLLKVDVDNRIPTTVSILAIHPLKVTRNQ